MLAGFMGKWYVILAGMVFCIGVQCLSSIGYARPPKRFHEGPYLQFLVGAMQNAHDSNVRTGQSVGKSVEPSFGFLFGWNITDPSAVEITGRYGTSKTFGATQHTVRLNINYRWNWIADRLTDFRSLRVLPFVQGGPVFHISVLPGDPAGAEHSVAQWGGGISAGGGFSLLLRQYIYCTVAGAADIVRRTTVSQLITGTSLTTYAGGWSVEWGTHAGIGVHF